MDAGKSAVLEEGLVEDFAEFSSASASGHIRGGRERDRFTIRQRTTWQGFNVHEPYQTLLSDAAPPTSDVMLTSFPPHSEQNGQYR